MIVLAGDLFRKHRVKRKCFLVNRRFDAYNCRNTGAL